MNLPEFLGSSHLLQVVAQNPIQNSDTSGRIPSLGSFLPHCPHSTQLGVYRALPRQSGEDVIAQLTLEQSLDNRDGACVAATITIWHPSCLPALGLP